MEKEYNRADVEKVVEENRESILRNVLAGEAELQSGEPFVTLDDVLAETGPETDNN